MVGRRKCGSVRCSGDAQTDPGGSRIPDLPLVSLALYQLSRLAAAETVATSAGEEVVCEVEKTRKERDAELRGEAVSLDE